MEGLQLAAGAKDDDLGNFPEAGVVDLSGDLLQIVLSRAAVCLDRAETAPPAKARKLGEAAAEWDAIAADLKQQMLAVEIPQLPAPSIEQLRKFWLRKGS